MTQARESAQARTDIYAGKLETLARRMRSRAAELDSAAERVRDAWGDGTNPAGLALSVLGAAGVLRGLRTEAGDAQGAPEYAIELLEALIEMASEREIGGVRTGDRECAECGRFVVEVNEDGLCADCEALDGPPMPPRS